MKQWQIFLIFGLFMLVLSSFDSAEAAASPISISSDSDSGDILEGESLVFTLTLENNDTQYKKMEVYMMAVWPGDIAWYSHIVDVNYDYLNNNLRRGMERKLRIYFFSFPTILIDLYVIY